jgi:hypothetical protein
MAVTININVLFVGPFRFGVWINIDMLNPFKDGQGILKSCDDRRHDGSDVLLRHFGDRVRRLFYSNKFYFINKLECAILGERLPTTMGKRCQISERPASLASHFRDTRLIRQYLLYMYIINQPSWDEQQSNPREKSRRSNRGHLSGKGSLRDY